MAYPAVADPPLSRQQILEQRRERLSWGFAFAVSPSKYIFELRDSDPEAYRDDSGKLVDLWIEYQKSVLAKAGLHSKSWVPYYLPDGSLVSLLVLGLGFGKVLYFPLKPGIIERVKEVLGADEEPKWYLFDARSRF